MSSSDRPWTPATRAFDDDYTGAHHDASIGRAPLITIGIPTYNRHRSLRRSVESALNQDYERLEVFVSDDASTDETEDLCRNLCSQDKRLRYQRQPTNRGVYANLATVLDRAQGEYFMWLSDDDWLDRNYVSECSRFLSEHPDYSLVCGRDRYFRGDKISFLGPVINLSEDSPKERVVTYFRRVTINGMLYGIMRREVLSALSLRPILGGDWLLISQIAFLGKTRTLETASINRSAMGESGDMERHAFRMGLSPRQAKNPHFFIARMIFKDIGWASPTYRSLGRLARLRVATSSFWGVFSRFCVRYYRSRVNDMLTKPVQRFIGRHVTWRFGQRPSAASNSETEHK